MALLQYDETNQETIDSSQFTPVPAGKYEAMIIDSESKPCKAAPMDQLVLVWKITSGEHENRRIWDRINMRQEGIEMSQLADNYQKAIQIGQKSLNTIFQALGVRASDSAELHDIPCIIDVKVKPATKDYPAGNEIRNYISMEAYAAGENDKNPTPQPSAPKTPSQAATKAAGQTVAAVARTTPATPAKKPWERSK